LNPAFSVSSPMKAGSFSARIVLRMSCLVFRIWFGGN